MLTPPNTKEILNNKFGTANPIMFEVVNKRIGMSRTVQVRCNGVYTYVISDPLVFYSRLCGNVATEFTRDEIDAQLKVEFVDALQPALGALAEQELRPAQIPAKANELKAAMNDALKQEWIENRGILKPYPSNTIHRAYSQAVPVSTREAVRKEGCRGNPEPCRELQCKHIRRT